MARYVGGTLSGTRAVVRTSAAVLRRAVGASASPARALGTLWGAGGLLIALASAIPPAAHHPTHRLIGTAGSATALALGILAHLFPPHLSPRQIHFLTALGTAFVTAGVYINDGVGNAPTAVACAMVYVWIVLYAGLYFSGRAALGHLLLCTAGCSIAFTTAQQDPGASGIEVVYVMGVSAGCLAAVSTIAAVLRRMATTDHLTGLPNRQALLQALHTETQRCARHGSRLAIAMFDLDRFKAVNDRLGHRAGDEILKSSTKRWSSQLRPMDALYRYGGDEFVMLLPGCDERDAREVCARVAGSGSHPCSFGVTAWRPGDAPSALLSRADRAAYEAKARSRPPVAAATRASAKPPSPTVADPGAAPPTQHRSAPDLWSRLVRQAHPRARVSAVAEGAVNGLLQWAAPEERGTMSPRRLRGRVAALLVVAASVVVAASAAIPQAPGSHHREAAALLALGALCVAAVLWRIAPHLGDGLMQTLMVGGSLLLGLCIFVNDHLGGSNWPATAGTRAVGLANFYLWIVIFAAFFFSVRTAALHLLLAAGSIGFLLWQVGYDSTLTVLLAETAIALGCLLVISSLSATLRRVVHVDPLTSLGNRLALEQALGAEIGRARRAEGQLALVLVDLDGFKAVNDTLGHQAGDRLLVDVSQRWLRQLRPEDVLTRYGGDEFVVLLPGCDAQEAEEVFTRIHEAGGHPCSGGIACLEPHESGGELLQRADVALYERKRARRTEPSAAAVAPTRAGELGAGSTVTSGAHGS